MASHVLLAGRYELRSLLREDAVKQVWAGYDRQLDRDVAVELVSTDDAGLQARFLNRARLLAAENPPLLATVYDTGRDDNQPFAVLEPLSGPTLGQRIKAGPAFALAEVVELGIALSGAVAAALQRELDVEPLDPDDVMLRDGEHVKLANVLLRPPVGAAVAGAPVSEQPLVARIASLLAAAMLAPTPLAAAPVLHAADLPTSLPATLRTIVLGAIAPRGASIRTLAELRVALVEYRGAAISTTRAFSPVPAAAIAGAGAVHGAATPLTRVMPPAIGARGAVAARSAFGVSSHRSRRPSIGLSIFALALALLLLGGAAAFAIWLGGVDRVASAGNTILPIPTPAGGNAVVAAPTPSPTPRPTATDTPTATPTPDLEAQGQLGGNPETPTVSGAKATETALAQVTATAGAIATLTATAGPTTTPTPAASPSATASPTPADSPTPTAGPPTATPLPTAAVPSVLQQNFAQAAAVLSQAGFSVQRLPDRSSTDVPAGGVLAQDPPPFAIVPLGSTIKLTVSSGPPLIATPKVTGMSLRAARDTLSAAGFGEKDSTRPSANVPEGVVINQNPDAGVAAAPGSVITLVVSAGNKVAAPKLIGMTENDAQDAIRAAGLTPTYVNRSGHDQSVQVGQVESQEPKAGTLVPPGTTVYINVRSS